MAVLFNSIHNSLNSKLHKMNSYKLCINKQGALKIFVKNKTLTIRS